MNKDLTKGQPEQVLWSFCLPLFGSIIFQQLYNIADSLIAGKLVGENALAAVGNSYEITLIFIAFAFGCNIGCSVIVSRYFGAKENHNVRTAVHTTLVSGGILCLVLMAAGFLGCRGLLHLIQTPEEIMADSRLYLNIYIAGLPFLFFYNIATGIFSAMGDSKTPFLFLAFSSTANIVVDYLFVRFLYMGVAGVAWATFLCQGLINGFGSSVIAGYAAAIKLNNLVITSFTTLGNGISNFTSQNLGAGKYERIHSGFKAGLKMVLALCVPVVAVYFLLGKWLVFLFMESAQGLAIDTGVQILRILAPFYFVVSVKLVTDGVLRGASRMKEFMTATFTDLILRVALAMVLSGMLGAVGIWAAWPVGWSFGAMVSLFFYKRLKNAL